MTQSSLTRLLIRVQIGSLIAFVLAAVVAMLVMMPCFADGAVIQHDGVHVDKTGAVRTAAEFEKYALREGIARYAGVFGLISAVTSMLAGFCLRSR